MHYRRYAELDWLRIILILAVFTHHVFMPFNGDDWHVMNTESSKLLDDIMVFFEQLRLQTLFFIAGAGSLLLLKKSSTTTFLRNKFHRLFVPLIVGMMFIIPPQHYYENLNHNGLTESNLLHAWQSGLFSFNANHLWFIEFLVVFMVIAIPIFWLFKQPAGRWLNNQTERLVQARFGLFSLVLLLIVLRAGLTLAYPTQSHSIDNLSVSGFFLFFFIAGMIFMNSQIIWHALAQHRKTNLVLFILSSIMFYGYYFPDFSPYASLALRWQLWWLVCSLVSWTGLLTLLGFAIACCHPHKAVSTSHEQHEEHEEQPGADTPAWLKHANELIYPFYILHQTVIVTVAYYVVQWPVGIAMKSITVLVSSLVICSFLCVVVIRPLPPLRYLFGLKPRKS